jgi:IclR family acetate operon transcriptional repressor
MGEQVAHMRNTGSIQVLARAAAILKALDSNRDGMTISELAHATRLPRPTVQRIVISLQKDGLMCNTGRGKRFGLGPELLRLALSVHLDLATVVQPVLDALSTELKETVNLLVQNGRHAVCIAQTCFVQELQIAPKLGNELPLHASASGKAMLSAMPEEEAKRLLGAGRWEKCTNKTLITWTELVYDLDQVRITGVATDIDEHTIGVAALAVPVATLCGKLHAVTVPAPTLRLQQKRASIERALRRTKR